MNNNFLFLIINQIRIIEEEKSRHKEMSEQKEKKLKEEDLKLLEDNKKRREEIQRYINHNLSQELSRAGISSVWFSFLDSYFRALHYTDNCSL